MRKRIFEFLLEVERVLNPIPLVFCGTIKLLGSKRANRLAWWYEKSIFKVIRGVLHYSYGKLGFHKTFFCKRVSRS